ncbi:hypothetical protein [Bordetella petrii]|uniref:hypothetical protein n=1 Tax=Bordetella petrii TaxID=94624 RepID=UPI001E654457|nr:hypothetical protein [Bordetella petrii]MCD0502818.1 hypothetical protein [Bordetella petrii]
MAAAAVVVLAGCSTPLLPYTYTPASAMSASGTVAIGEFTYDPNKYLQSLADGQNTDGNEKFRNTGLSTSQQHSGGPPGAYAPAKSAILPNQARNTAAGSILFEHNVADIMRHAAFTELRAIGLRVSGRGIDRVLTGEVQNLMADDLGMNIDWTLRVVYTVSDRQTENVLYSSVAEIKRSTPKFMNVMGALNDLIRLNIEALVSDPKFLEAVRGQDDSMLLVRM